ncbi:MAG: molybdopterin-binding protein [Defluviitaleaceae bacterium]|nr:molybdopterin-binding protein [Defluviitaleaceae bacterium]
MRKIRTEEAVGHVIPHDLTQIIPGEFKGVRFKKGHVVREEDIPVLLSMGKEHLFILEAVPEMVHEDEGAAVLAEISISVGMAASAPSEGRIDLIADTDGLLKVDTRKLVAINSIGRMVMASRHGGSVVRKGDKIAGMRIIPLMIERDALATAREIGGVQPIFHILPFEFKRCAIITTGGEVASGRIQDAFTPVVEAKLAEFPSEIIGRSVLGDEYAEQTAAIRRYAEQGADMIILTGGMSVDPDDQTPLAIRNSGARIVAYGAPVLPGAMIMVAYYNNIPVLGLPGCVMYSKRTIFDILLPRIFANEPITGEIVANLGHGGLCLNCGHCTFPNCGFAAAH